MKYLDTFTGIGGFTIPLEELGCECIGFSEIDKYAQSVYLKHFPAHKPYGDITKIIAEDLPDFDIFTGGFPCQSFSIAGKRRGFEDTRGTMFFEIARIVREKQPRLLLLENVKGLLSHDEGRTFRTIIITLDELGYDAEWQVLNSKDFGVPQNRERVYIIGHLRGTGGRQVFPIERANANAIKQLNDPKMARNRLYHKSGISPTLQTGTGGGHTPFIVAQRGRYNEDGTTSQKLEPRKDGVNNTLTGVQKDNLVYTQNPKMNDYKKRSITGALIASMYKEPPVVNGIRRLTPTECERLQGFPDNWTKYGKDNEEISDTQRYKMCGNAVTVNVIREIVYNRNFPFKS